ncbi:MAG: type III pantothenate kinase [Sphaerochaetaceae bacterium]
MLLVVDIGNTNIVMALHDGSSWLATWRIHSDQKKTGDEYFVIVERMLSQKNIDLQSIQSAVISSVVPKLTKPFQWVVNSLCTLDSLVINHDSIVHLVRSSIPAELGYDLLANAEAAHALYPDKTCMVLDLGTALTLTTVNEKGEVLGASIAPGLETAVYALFSNTAQIPAVQLKAPKTVIGRTSEEAIQSGIMFGFAGLVKELVKRTEQELHTTVQLIATGGMAQLLAPIIDRVDHIEPLLTLEGLRIMATKE